jgi:hypothetical protein
LFCIAVLVTIFVTISAAIALNVYGHLFKPDD